MNNQLTLPIAELTTAKQKEANYWLQVFSDKTKINIQERGRLALTHFIDADKMLKENLNCFKLK